VAQKYKNMIHKMICGECMSCKKRSNHDE
jgi:hypothetical protein